MIWIVVLAIFITVVAITQTARRPGSFISQTARRPGNFREPHLPNSSTVVLSEIARLYSALESSGSDGSFAVLIPPALEGETDALNIQFSIERGAIGLDWYLLSPVNVRDKKQFVALLQAEDAPLREAGTEDCRYIRTQDPRAPLLCRRVLEEMYGVTDDVKLDLVAEGFDWPRDDG